MKIWKPRGENHLMSVACLQPSQRNFIELLATCGYKDLTLHLESFTQWVWEKSDLSCWAPVLNRFDDIFSCYLDAYRGYVKGQHDSVSDFYNDGMIRLVCNALKASVMIVENCTSKCIYNSLELLTSFLDDVHPEIVFQATKLICVYFSRYRKNAIPKATWEVSVRMGVLSQTPLADSTCRVHMAKQPTPAQSSQKESSDSAESETPVNVSFTDVMEFYASKSENFLTVDSYIEIAQGVGGSGSSTLSIPVTDILNVQRYVGAAEAAEYPKTTEGNKMFAAAVSAWKGSLASELDIYKHVVASLRQLIRKYKIEECYFVELKYKVCKVFALHFPAWQRKTVEIRICALISMLFMKNGSYADFLNCNPSFLLELTHMVERHRELDRSTMVIVTELLSAMVHDGSHAKTLATLLGLNTAHGIFFKVLRHYLRHAHEMVPLPPLMSFKSPAETKQFASASEMWAHYHPNENHAMNEDCCTSVQLQGAVVPADVYLNEWKYTVRLASEKGRAKVRDEEDSMRILLQLLIVFYTFISSHGCNNALTCTSVLEGVAHFVRNRDPIYLPVVIYVVQVIETLLDYNQTVSRILRNDLKVFHIFISRMQFDMYQIKHGAPFENWEAESTPWPNGWKMPQTNDLVTLRSYWMSMSDMSARRFLLKTLIHHIDAASRPMVDRNDTLVYDVFSDEGAVVPMLHAVFTQPQTYGLGVYSSAINLISDALNEDPLLQEDLHTVGIMPALLSSICEENLKSEDCLNVVPNIICDVLSHRSGRDYMKKVQYAPVLKLIDIVTQRDFVLFDRFGEVATTIGMSLDNLAQKKDSLNVVIVDRFIKAMYVLLQEALNFPPFNPKDSAQCAKELDTYMNEFRTHPAEITVDMLASLDNLASHDFIADRIAHLGKCLSSFLRSRQALSLFVSCDGLKLLYQLCTLPCLPPMSTTIYSRHPITLLLKYILSHAPAPCISYLYGLCRPYSTQHPNLDIPRTDEEVMFNLKYLGSFHAITETIYFTHLEGNNMYETCCSGRFQMGASTISRCDLHMTVSAHLRKLITVFPHLMRTFCVSTNVGDVDTLSILDGKHKSHGHPQVRAYKMFNRDKKIAQTSENSFSSNDLFWHSQFAYAYSNHNPAYNGSPSPYLSDDKFKMYVEVCRLSLATCKGLLYGMNRIINKAITTSNADNTCLRNSIAHHTLALTLLCLKMLSNTPSPHVTSGSGLVLDGMDCLSTARYVSESVEVACKLLADDREMGGIYILPFVVFCEMNGMAYLNDVFNYLMTMYLGCALAFALRVHKELTVDEVLSTNYTGDRSRLLAVVDLVESFDLRKIKDTMELWGRSVQQCLSLFYNIGNSKAILNTKNVAAIWQFMASPAFGNVIGRDRKISELITAAVTTAGSLCWEWLQIIASVRSNAPSNTTASLYFYISSTVLSPLLEVQLSMLGFLAKARQELLKKHLDPKKPSKDDEQHETDAAGDATPLNQPSAGSGSHVQQTPISGEAGGDDSRGHTSDASRSILLEMGFSESDIERAIAESGRNDITSIADWLVNRANDEPQGASATDGNAMTVDTSSDLPSGGENLTGYRLAVKNLPIFNCFDSTATPDNDPWIFDPIEKYPTFTAPDPAQVRKLMANSFLDTLLYLSTKMPSSLRTIAECIIRSLSAPLAFMVGGKYAPSPREYTKGTIWLLLQSIYGSLNGILGCLNAVKFPMDKRLFPAAFCPVFFFDECTKDAALECTVLAGKPMVAEAYHNDLVLAHEQLLGMFFVLAQLIDRRRKLCSAYLSSIDRPIDVMLNLLEYFQKWRYDAHYSGVLTFAAIGMKPSLSGIPISVPEWCLRNEVAKDQGTSSKAKGQYKADYVMITNGFLRNYPEPQMSSPPPFFKYALVAIAALLKTNSPLGFFDLLSSIALSNNVELLDTTKTLTFVPKSSQKKLVRLCLNILECFPSLCGHVTGSVLFILQGLTEIYSNVGEFLNYKRLPPQENYPAHFNSKLEFDGVIGADAISILLMIPRTGYCKGMKGIVSKILLNCMENPYMLRNAIEKRVTHLLTANSCEPVALSTLVDEVAPFAKKDPAMLMEILQKQCVLTVEEDDSDVDLGKARVTSQQSSRISELLESNRDLLSPGDISILENSNKDHTAVADYDVLLCSFLRILEVHIQILGNIQGFTLPPDESDDNSKPLYPLAFTMDAICSILSSFCYNFPIVANGNRLPQAEDDLIYKQLPLEVNVIDAKDGHLVVIHMFRRILSMLCALAASSQKGRSSKEGIQDIPRMNRAIMTAMRGFSSAIVLICSTSMKMNILVLEEIKMLLQYLVGLKTSDYSTYPFSLALYTSCDMLHQLLQLRYGDGDLAELSTDSVSQMSKCLVSMFHKLDLNRDDSNLLCGVIIRALVSLTAPEKNATLAVDRQDKVGNDYSYQGEDDMEVIEVSSSSSELDDMELQSEEDISDSDSEELEEYMEDAMDEDVATDSSGTESDGSDVFLEVESQYDSESDDESSDDSSDSDDMDTDEGSVGNDDVDMALPHQVEETYEEIANSDSESNSSMEEVDEDEEDDDDDAPRIRVVGELDGEYHEDAITGVMEETRPHINMDEDRHDDLSPEYYSFSDEDEFENGDSMLPAASTSDEQGNDVSVSIPDPSATAPVTGNSGIRIQIDFGGQGDVNYTDSSLPQLNVAQRLPRVVRAAPDATSDNDSITERNENPSSSDQLASPTGEATLNFTKESSEKRGNSNIVLMSMIAMGLPRIQLPKSSSAGSAEASTEHSAPMQLNDGPSDENTATASHASDHNDAVQLDSSPQPNSSDARQVHTNQPLEHIPSDIRIRQSDLIALTNMDPSVLAELPEDVRDEIIMQHLRAFDIDTLLALHHNAPMPESSQSASTTRNEDLRNIQSLPRAESQQVMRSAHGTSSSRSDPNQPSRVLIGDNNVLPASMPSLTNQILAGATRNLVESLLQHELAGNRIGRYRVQRMRNERHRDAAEPPSNAQALRPSVTEIPVRTRTGPNQPQLPGLTFGLIIGEFRDDDNPRIRATSGHRSRHTPGSRRMGHTRIRRRVDTNARGMNFGNFMMREDRVPRVIRSAVGETGDLGAPTQGAADRAGTPAATFEPIVIRDRGRSGIDSRILQTIPQLFNTLNPQVLNMLHSAGRFLISTAPTASQLPASSSEPRDRINVNSLRQLERVIEFFDDKIPISLCAQREEPSGAVVKQLLDTCGGVRYGFVESDIVGICRLIYLKYELNRRVYFKIFRNLILMNEQIGHTLLRCFLHIMHTSILGLSNSSVPNVKTDKFFHGLPRLCNSRRNDFPPAHLYGKLPYRHVSLDGRVDADNQCDSFIITALSQEYSMECINMSVGYSSYVSCERVLEQLRSLLIALPGAIQLFGLPIAAPASEEGSSRSDSRNKRTKVSGAKSEKRSAHRHLYPIGFLFMATATKLFQSSPKLMNHLMMVIQHLVVSPKTLDAHGALVAPVSIDDPPTTSPAVVATPPENSESVEVAAGNDEGVAAREDDATNASGESSQASNSSSSHHDSILRVKQDILNKLDKDAVNVFLEVHTSWRHQSHWLLCCTTTRDGSSSVHLQLVATIMSALLLSERHASNVQEFLVARLNELIGVLCRSLLDNQTQKTGRVAEGASTPALQRLISTMMRIVTFVKETFTEVHRSGTSVTPDKGRKPKRIVDFYSNVNFDELWRAVDSTLTGLAKAPKPHTKVDPKEARSTQLSSSGDGLLDNSRHSEQLLTLVPIIGAFMDITQIRVALDYMLDDVSELNNTMSFVNFDYDLPDGNLDFIAVSRQKRPPKKEPWDCDENSVEMSPNHLSLIYFAEKHCRVLNCLIKRIPSLLYSSFAPLLRLAPNCLNFDIKRNYFRQKLKEVRQGLHLNTLRINVRREHVFMDSYHQLRLRSGDDMKGKLVVTFSGEEGVDAGGLTREWFSMLAKEMFNPNYGLFCREGRKQEFNHPNPLSGINPDHLNFFKFIGRVIGKALHDSQHIDAYFCRSFYKHMLNRKITPVDAESVDPQFYQNLTSINNCRLEDLGLELFFSTEIDEFGKVKVIDLIPDGRNIPVTDDNKQKYIELLCRHKVTNGIKDQLDAFMSGFRELISPDLISIFDHKELELLISGTPSIDLANLRENVEYRNYTKDSEQIIWLWEFLEDLDQSNLAAFLQFVTGTSRVPIGGFKNLMGMRGPQRITIHRACNSEHLPSAHTCFNQLNLPAYSSRETLKQKMLQAILEGKEGWLGTLTFLRSSSQHCGSTSPACQTTRGMHICGARRPPLLWDQTTVQRRAGVHLVAHSGDVVVHVVGLHLHRVQVVIHVVGLHSHNTLPLLVRNHAIHVLFGIGLVQRHEVVHLALDLVHVVPVLEVVAPFVIVRRVVVRRPVHRVRYAPHFGAPGYGSSGGVPVVVLHPLRHAVLPHLVPHLPVYFVYGYRLVEDVELVCKLPEHRDLEEGKVADGGRRIHFFEDVLKLFVGFVNVPEKLQHRLSTLRAELEAEPGFPLVLVPLLPIFSVHVFFALLPLVWRRVVVSNRRVLRIRLS
ncbi:ubiquitin ligase [Babesia ovata]|uniref:HECT-type E3 ubiquitin transferase n=1 Tax=Babesia ovata TaxID=189622 RepID=A0A2H6K9T2_9APIC|nr:ubiquitin ligase [Babesia ovata]GBE59709.1 ubiquitin ligase [Babesia ovata]